MGYLENAIIDYINNNPNKRLDGVDITTYFKLRADIVMNALWNLKEEGRVIYHQVGLRSWYTTSKLK